MDVSITIHDVLLWSLGISLKTGFPLIILILVVGIAKARSKCQDLEKMGTKSTKALWAVCCGLWVFTFGEHYSAGAIPIFDYGAPLVMLATVICVPVLLPMSLYFEMKSQAGKPPYSLVSAIFLLGLISIAPGLYAVWFYAAMLAKA